MGNMAYTAHRAGIEPILFQEGFQFINIEIPSDPFTSRNPSHCFVDLPSLEDAERAMRHLSGQPFQGRPLEVKPCVQKRPRAPRSQSDELQSMRWQRDTRERPNTRHLPPAIGMWATDLLAPIKEGRRLFVGGLSKPIDNHSSDLEIRRIFEGFQVEAVSKAKRPERDPPLEHDCYAFVDLSTYDEAQRAAGQLHGMELWGGKLTVKTLE
ncbi:hypothetical protein FB567DRAFT_158660 [Paraphoma chrysanthemicola]|uniref:RRM domain-containing protein n=1 Tax=Paraphoma chrysanthemicola TaxID=798071 RepID=A0A8K0RE51_9PLEO|nr:hypothetical protein FB567DRAFT_158660 [Paraphoma chrysanthemicola]